MDKLAGQRSGNQPAGQPANDDDDDDDDGGGGGDDDDDSEGEGSIRRAGH